MWPKKPKKVTLGLPKPSVKKLKLKKIQPKKIKKPKI
jgi:hypothetical protein